MLGPPIQKLRSCHYLNRLNIGWQTMAYIPRTVTENPAQPGIRLQIEKNLFIYIRMKKHGYRSVYKGGYGSEGSYISRCERHTSKRS